MTDPLTARPFVEDMRAEDAERAEVLAAQSGDRDALETIAKRHQPWILHLAERMTGEPGEAEDATQEILVLVITRLSTFAHRSRFRTWLYRIAINHLLGRRRGAREQAEMRFSDIATQIDVLPIEELADPRALAVDRRLLADEVRIGCTAGMLLCLDRDQRMAFLLGEVLDVKDTLAGELLDITPAAFRKRLSRARRDLYQFMDDKCGLMNPDNPCRCRGKTQALIRAGFVDPERLRFARSRVNQVNALVSDVATRIGDAYHSYADVFRDHPFDDPESSAERNRRLDELLESLRADPHLGG